MSGGVPAHHLPYFIYAFSKIGEEGIGPRRARYRLEQVVARNLLAEAQEKIFDGEVVRNKRLPTIWEDVVDATRGLDGDRIGLEFLTPTFVKFHGAVSSEALPFAALVQALLIRIPMLSAVHCGEVWRENFKALVDMAGEVKTARDETTWVSFRRYSSFRGKAESLEGIVGSVEYTGPAIEKFLPLLCMGQLTHVGKRAVFGLRRYSIAGFYGR